MARFTLYEQLTREAALQRLGTLNDCRSICDGQWVIAKDTILCFAHIGEAPERCHFSTGSIFNWVAERPFRVSDEPFSAIPMEIRAGSDIGRSMHLFAAPSSSTQFTYVGEIGRSHAYGNSPGHGTAVLNLAHALPSSIWSRFGGPEYDEMLVKSLMDALVKPLDAMSIENRQRVLSLIVDYWFGATSRIGNTQRLKAPERQVPPALRQWYRRYSGLIEKMGCPNRFLREDQLETDRDGKMTFYVEEQCVDVWATLPEGDDPPVWFRVNEEGKPWILERSTLSTFLIQACMVGGIWYAPYGAVSSWIDQKTFDRITGVLHPLPLQPWRWPVDPSRFFGRDGAFMFACHYREEERDAYSVWIGANSEIPLSFLKDIVDDSWDYTAF